MRRSAVLHGHSLSSRGRVAMLACGFWALGACSSDGPAPQPDAGADARLDSSHADLGKDGAGVDRIVSDTQRPAPRWESFAGPTVWGHTATLLDDGRVLVVGGGDEYKPVAEAWLFLPATSTFISGGKMSVGRRGHTATLLQDGRVLVAGGEKDHYDVYSSAEVFNPTKPVDQAWSLAKSMPGPRSGHSAVRLKDGRVLLAGGQGLSAPATLDTLVIYDSVSDSWSAPIAKLSVPRDFFSATLLESGKVLFAGGTASGTEVTWHDSMESFDPAAGTVAAPSAKLSGPRAFHTAHGLPGNKVLLVGGKCDGYGACKLKGDDLYDVVMDKVSSIAHFGTEPPMSHASCALLDGRVLIVGGEAAQHEKQVVVFSIATASWEELPAMSEGREHHSATTLQDGSVLVVGGEPPSATTPLTTAARLFNP